MSACKDGKQRPLGMPVWSDKLLAEVIRLILEAYFEPRFSRHSHGFRPGRGCHTALQEISHKWAGTVWYLEGDISKCFERLNHQILIATVKEHFHDERFIRLVQQLLDAGYLEDGKFHQTISGVPQGSIVSPILSNILLDKLDQYIEAVLIPKYTKGDEKRANPVYRRLVWRAHDLHKRGKKEQVRQLRKQFRRLPSRDPNDPNYRRLRYCRYADDFLLGFMGPKAEAEEIKEAIGVFLREELKLELSETKTLITHARSDAARFLGYEVILIATWGGIPLKWNSAAEPEDQPVQRVWASRSELERRLQAQMCEQCGATSPPVLTNGSRVFCAFHSSSKTRSRSILSAALTKRM